MSNYCGDCGDIMNGKLKCQCGWRDDSANPIDHQCSFHDGYRQCPMPGSLSRSITGGGRWFCSAHFKSIGDPITGRQILDDYEKNPPQVIDWRDQALADYKKRIEEKMQAQAQDQENAS